MTTAKQKTKLNSVGSYANDYMLNDIKPDNIDYRESMGKNKNPYVATKNNNTVLFKAKNSPSYSTQLSGNYLYKSVSTDLKDYADRWSITIRPKDILNLVGLMI